MATDQWMGSGWNSQRRERQASGDHRHLPSPGQDRRHDLGSCAQSDQDHDADARGQQPPGRWVRSGEQDEGSQQPKQPPPGRAHAHPMRDPPQEGRPRADRDLQDEDQQAGREEQHRRRGEGGDEQDHVGGGERGHQRDVHPPHRRCGDAF